MTLYSSITKEEVRDLPLVHIDGRIITIDKEEDVAAAVAYLRKSPVIGFDTETRPSFAKGVTYKVALLQLATEDTCFLFRLNKIGFSVALKSLLQSSKIKKIGLSSHDDILSLKRRCPFRPMGFIELQTLVKSYGIKEMSLQKIYAIIFGQRISKGQRLTNWEADILTEKQRVYAATDAWTTLRIYNTISKFQPEEISVIDNTEVESEN